MRLVEPTKVCANPECAHAGERQPWSSFYAKVKWPDGTMRQPQSRCARCMKASTARRKREQLAKLTPEQRCAFNKARYADVKADPERLAVVVEKTRQWHERRRRLRGVPPRWPQGAPSRRSRTTDDLPPGPFAAWFRSVMERDESSIRKTAARLGMQDKTMREVLKGRRNVELGTVERALIVDGVHLRDVYPDLYLEVA